MPAKDVVRLEAILMKYSLRCFPDRIDHISHCLEVCATWLREQNGHVPAVSDAVALASLPLDDQAISELEILLAIPLETLGLHVLELENYSDLLECLPWTNRRNVARTIVEVVVNAGEMLEDLGRIEYLFNIIAPLLHDVESRQRDGNPDISRTADLFGSLDVNATVSARADDDLATSNPPAVREDQELVSKLLHLLGNNDTDISFEILSIAKKHLALGGKHRMSYTVPALVYASFRLLSRIQSLEFPPDLHTDDTTVADEAQGEQGRHSPDIPVVNELGCDVAEEGKEEEKSGISTNVRNEAGFSCRHEMTRPALSMHVK